MEPVPTPHRIAFRKAAPEDLGGLLALETACFSSYYRAHRFSEQQFRYYLQRPNTVAFVATMNGKLVGYVLGVVQRGRLKDTAHLYSIAVDSSVRRQGAGRALLRRFIAAAKRSEVQRFLLEVAVANRKARKLFEAEGFRKVRIMPDYYGEGHDGIKMEKTI